MASSLARGQQRGRSAGSGRSTSPSWREGHSSRDRPGAGNNSPAGSFVGSGAVDCGSGGSWMPGGFEIGDYVTYIGPSYTFPGTGVTLKHGLEGEMMGYGANVPVEYRSHQFLSIRFFGHTGETNVPPDALAPCFRPPAGPWAGSSREFEQQPLAAGNASGAHGGQKEGQGTAVKSTHRPEGADSVEDYVVCCTGPEPVHGTGDRQGAGDRSSCDIASVLDFFFGDGHPDKSNARSPAIATSTFPHPPSPRTQDLQKRQLQQQPQVANPAILGSGSQSHFGGNFPGKKSGPSSSTTSLIGGQRRAG